MRRMDGEVALFCDLVHYEKRLLLALAAQELRAESSGKPWNRRLIMAAIGDGFKNIFLAGIGAMAITAEKGKELVDQLVAKGEITVEQGKQINTELKHKAASTVAGVRDDLLEAHMKTMTPEARAAFLERAAEIAAKVDACAVEVEGEVVEEVAAEAAAEGAAAEACEKPAGSCKDADKDEPQEPSA